MAGNDGNVPQEPPMVGLPPHVPQHYTAQQYEQWKRRNHMTTQRDFEDQQNVFHGPEYIRRSYLRETGFRNKKVMWASRVFIQSSLQFRVLVSPFKCLYQLQDNNCLKVGAVVFPRLRPAVNNERVYEEIVAANIPGCYLYWRVMSYDPDANNPIHRMSGILYSVRIMRNVIPNDPIIDYGMICGIYPYFLPAEGYVPFLEFNLRDTRPRGYQNRLTPAEMEPGIFDTNTATALNCLRNYALILAGLPPMFQNCAPVTSLSAIYVPAQVTLVVSVENMRFNPQIQREEAISRSVQGRCHETFVIQAGGLVALLNYRLYFRFMNDGQGREYRFQDLEHVPDPVCVQIWDFMRRVNHPLIVLNRIYDPNCGTDHPHYAGYHLEIKNHRRNRRAVLQIPFGGHFSNVYELGINIMPAFANTPNAPTFGLDFLDTQGVWQVPEPYRDYTGSINSMGDTDLNRREPFPE